MNTVERSYLLQVLRDHRDTIAQSWYRAIARTSFVPLGPADIRARLLALTDELITALLAEPFEPCAAQAVGAAFAQLHFMQPESLARTLIVLEQQLSAGLSVEQRADLLPRMTALLSELAAGFYRQSTAMILLQQEQLRDALFTERSRVDAELAQAQRRLAGHLEAERLRLARELHDSAVQQLLGISYQLIERRHHVVGEDIDIPPADELYPTLEDIRREVLGVVSQIRSLIGELRPAGLEELGLTTALEGYIARLKREGGPRMPRIDLDLDQSRTTLPQPIALCLFRSAQEALRNALKHARARRITVSLRLSADEAVLNVRDDGCGFRVPARLSELALADHFGLVGIAERVASAGGQYVIASQPAWGTDVTIRIQLSEARSDDDEAHPGAAGR